MSEAPEKTKAEAQMRKYCMDGKMEEGGIGKIKVRKTSTDEGNGSDEKRKWPVLCDANPYIVDLWNNLFKKEETPPPPESTQPEQTS